MGSDSSWIRELELDWNLTLTGTWPWQELDLDWNLVVFTGSGLRGGWHTADPRRTGTGTEKVERSRTILRAAGVDHQLIQASQRMGTFFRRVKHRSSLGHRIRLRQEIQSGSRERWWIPVELVSKVSETRKQSWILLGDRPPAYSSFSTDGHVF